MTEAPRIDEEQAEKLRQCLEEAGAVLQRMADHLAAAGKQAIEETARVLCSCPDIDVTAAGAVPGSEMVKGLDARCVIHGRVGGQTA